MHQLLLLAGVSVALLPSACASAPNRRNERAVGDVYQLGVAISDITGPASEITFMGYGVGGQKAAGIHFRQRARAFIVDDGKKSVCYVSGDMAMPSDIVNHAVLEQLQLQLGEAVYTRENLLISGTHTHSTPGGFDGYVIGQISQLGFIKESYEALVAGITDAVVKAHKSKQQGRIRYNKGMLFDANINRSPTSYLLNPKSERDEYSAEGDTDKTMLLMRFDALDGTPLGMLNWFAVHGTSMNNTNRLISGDNRGYASMLFEQAMNGDDVLPGDGAFVAAFASTNLGDVSPNTAGPRCLDTGEQCDHGHSTCNGRNEKCVAFGPGTNGDNFESTEIIGRKQFEKAISIYEAATLGVTGAVDFRHSIVKMKQRNVTLENGSLVKMCGASLGYAFAAGTTDGPGQFDFTQGENSTNPLWRVVSGLLSKPTEQEIACQAPKPILLNMQDIHTPYDWEPSLIPVQVLRIGNLITIGAPTEFTTMSGRRIRKAIKGLFAASKTMAGQDVQVVMGGISNGYTHYTATFEEYQAQRYEAASTLYGPHQLAGYIQELSRISTDMISGRPSTSDAPPVIPDMSKYYSFQTPVLFDVCLPWRHFGEVLTDAKGPYTAGSSLVSITYQAANLRNNRRTNKGFMTVEVKKGTSGDWKAIASDSSWETKLHWKSVDPVTQSMSEVTIEWAIPSAAPAGTYRICFVGDRKTVLSHIEEFSGCSSEFLVAANDVLV